jgi:hypothetical protein
MATTRIISVIHSSNSRRKCRLLLIRGHRVSQFPNVPPSSVGEHDIEPARSQDRKIVVGPSNISGGSPAGMRRADQGRWPERNCDALPQRRRPSA